MPVNLFEPRELDLTAYFGSVFHHPLSDVEYMDWFTPDFLPLETATDAYFVLVKMQLHP